jgi:hypothetical protein
MATYPFVNFKMLPTKDISSTPMLIFGNDQYTCLLDRILLSNLTNNQINVTLYIAREVVIGTETDFILANQVSIEANDRIDIIQNASLTLQPGDLLYAFSDFAANVFNAFVSYRELTELTSSIAKQQTSKLLKGNAHA